MKAIFDFRQNGMQKQMISVVTPTFFRPEETVGLLKNLAGQDLMPVEVILVDGAPPEERMTEMAVKKIANALPFKINYIRQSGGTAIQRNFGIDAAIGDFIAFIDDDVRLESDFFSTLSEVFEGDSQKEIGGVVGYRTNQHFSLAETRRWRWYKRLKLLTTFEPGSYDFNCGYPINNNLQPPFEGTREIDFMTTACALWRREVFAAGLRFHPFFSDYGVLEDAHFSLRAKKDWDLLQCGTARCEEMHSPNGRVNSRRKGYKCVVNYYFVFQELVKPLTFRHKFRFWRYQAFEYFRIAASAVRRRNPDDLKDLYGRLEGVIAVVSGAYKNKEL